MQEKLTSVKKVEQESKLDREHCGRLPCWKNWLEVKNKLNKLYGRL